MTRKLDVIVECASCSTPAEQLVVERFRERGVSPSEPGWWPTKAAQTELYLDGTVHAQGDNGTESFEQFGDGRYRWLVKCPRCGRGSPVRAERMDIVLDTIVQTAASYGLTQSPIVDVLFVVDQAKDAHGLSNPPAP